jgi:hypothetical protein
VLLEQAGRTPEDLGALTRRHRQPFGLRGHGSLDGGGHVIRAGQADIGQRCAGGGFDHGGAVCGFFPAATEQVALPAGRIEQGGRWGGHAGLLCNGR